MNRSYDHYVTGGGAWTTASYQDYMLRAIVQGPTGRQVTIGYDNPVVYFSNIIPGKGAIGVHASNQLQGIQDVGEARYMAIHNTNPLAALISSSSSWETRLDRELIGYNIISGEFGDEPNWQTWGVINALVEDTIYTDLEWVNLVDGTVYTYGVRSVYTNDNMSDPAFSNWVGKDMYASLEVTLTTNIGDIPVGAEVTLEATAPDPDGNYPEYTGITGATGQCTITGIWKGNYDFEAKLLNFADLEDNIDILEDVVTYSGMITEMMYPAFDVYVEENHLENAWITWHSPAGALSTFFDFEDNDGEFVGDAGWEWENGCNAGNAWSGENCWSTWPGISYPNNANTSLYTPLIDVPSDETQLTFYHWYDMETYWDGGNVKISLDEGGSWTLITPVGGYNGTAVGLNGEACFNGYAQTWTMATFDLSMYEDEEVMFRFQFGSDASVVYLGWDIDDVYIGEPDDRGRLIPLLTEKEVNANPFSKATETVSRLERLEGYSLFRGFEDDQENYENWDVIVQTYQDTAYEDTTWPDVTLAGVYMYCVRVEYTGGVMSEPSFSNWIGKGMYATLEVSLTTNIGDIPVGALVTLEATEPDPDGDYPEYTGITDENGECTIDGIWKGNYDLTAELLNFAVLEENIDILEDEVTYTGMITEMMYPAFDVYVEENHSGNAWLTWHSPAGSISSFFDFEDNDGEFTGETGWEWANGSNSGNAWSGENCWSTWPGITYPNSVNTSLYTPILEVPSDETQLTFYHWYEMESYCDGGNVKISLDEGGSWTLITPVGGYNGTAIGLNSEACYNGYAQTWALATFDLSMYDGEEVMFRFNFGTDSSVVYDGWDIDDVYVGEPEDRGRPIPLLTEKEVKANQFSKSKETTSRLDRLEGYSLFRGFADDQANFEDWDLIVVDVQDTTYEDTSWQQLTEPGTYMYCVRAQYTGGVLSEPSFSNEIGFDMYVPVTIGVTGNSGDPMDGALVTLECQDGVHTYGGTISGGIVYWEEVWKGVYDITIVMNGYDDYEETDVWITDTTVMNVVMLECIYPPSNVAVDAETGLFTWEVPVSRDALALGSDVLVQDSKKTDSALSLASTSNIAGRDRHVDYYNVYLNDDLEGQTTDLEFQFTGLVPQQTYTAGVSAHYSSNTESEIIEVVFTYTGPYANGIDSIPEVTALNSNYPNPFNPETCISFGLAEAGNVRIDIYNVKGQKIKTLVNETKAGGNYQITWYGTDDNNRQVASGIYFYKMRSGIYSSTRKMILMK